MTHTATPAARSPELARRVAGCPIAMMTTCLPGGELDAKPMTVLDYDEQGQFWFFCEHDPDDAGAQERYTRVNLSFSAEAECSYASVYGHGELLRDAKRIRELWTPMAQHFFPDGPDAPRLALLKVTPERSEYWDAPDSLMARGAALNTPPARPTTPSPLSSHL